MKTNGTALEQAEAAISAVERIRDVNSGKGKPGVKENRIAVLVDVAAGYLASLKDELQEPTE